MAEFFRTRRNFLKVVFVGGTAAGLGCRPKPEQGAPAIDAGRTATSTAALIPPKPERLIAGETFERCHAVRDGLALPTAATVSAEHEIVIVGGGPSGLCAAHFLRDRDVMLLEKEAVWGGNCTFDDWEGVRMGTGGAFYTESETELVALFAELGIEGTKIVGTDSLVINGEPVTDFFRDGAAHLPFPQKVKDDFRRSRDDLVKLFKAKKSKKAELDATPFAKLLEPYSPEVKTFWDRFGKSNWGSDSLNTSGYVGCEAYSWAGGADDARWSFPGGLAGGVHQFGQIVAKALGDRAVLGASVIRIEREGKGKKERAVVHYMVGDEPRAVRARAVIVAVPKVFAKMILPGLPKEQFELMKANRYEPFPVFNVCLGSPGPEPAYDNWFLDAPFTDFVPADWIVHAGKGPADRKSALTVYHPLELHERALLLVDQPLLDMADGVAEHLERHFPGTMKKIEEVHIYRRGHAMVWSEPGRFGKLTKMSKPFGPIHFAHTDSGEFATFYAGLGAAERAVAGVRTYLKRA